MKKTFAICFAMFTAVTLAFAQATPPDLVNFQGVLRDSSDAPLDGPFDMVFRFFDDPAVGSELLVDSHLAAGSGAVTVTGGLFNVALGSGTVTGVYTSLTDMFRDYSAVYVEVQVGADPAMTPRIQVVSAAYALNTDHLDGLDSTDFAALGHTHVLTAGATDVTATAAEVNRLSGVGPTVTAANLTGLTDGSNADALHAHSGGGGDADTLDTLDSLQFLRSDVDDTAAGNITFNLSVGAGGASPVTNWRINSTYGASAASGYGAVRGEGINGPTYGYLGVQGATDFDGVLTADWGGREIGVAGVSTGGSSTDNYGVLGHSNYTGVKGEADGAGTNYGVYGTALGGTENWGLFTPNDAYVGGMLDFGGGLNDDLTASDVTELTYGGTTALHTHAAGDADTLDSLDSTDFAAVAHTHTLTSGATDVTATAAEVNRLSGVGPTVTAANLTTVTDGSNADALHAHDITGTGDVRYLRKDIDDTAAGAITFSKTIGVGIAPDSLYGVYSSGSSTGGRFIGTTRGVWSQVNETSASDIFGVSTKATDAGTTATTVHGTFSVADATGASNNKSVYGLWAEAKGAASSQGVHCGVFGSASSASNGPNYGVYGAASGGSENWGLYTTDYAHADNLNVGTTTQLSSWRIDSTYGTGGAGYGAVRGQGANAPTKGYLGVQGATNFDGVATADWSGWEIGVAGISTGTSAPLTDNYGVLGHSNYTGVFGEAIGTTGTLYGVYGTASGGTENWGIFTPDDAYVGSSLLVDTGTIGVGIAPESAKGVYSYVNGNSSSNLYGVYAETINADTSNSEAIYGTFSKADATGPAPNTKLVYGLRGEATGASGSDGSHVGVSGRAYGGDGDHFGISGTANQTSSGGFHYGVNGTASGGAANYGGWFSGTDYGVYGQSSGGWGIYTPDNARLGDAITDRHRFWGWIQAGSTSDDHRILSNAGNWGYIGDATYYWYRMYANRYYAITQTFGSFDTYPDLDMLDAMEIVPHTDEKTGKTEMIFTNLPPMILGDPAVDGERADRFVDLSKAISFTFGSLRQMRAETKGRDAALRDELNLRTPDKKTGKQTMDGNLQIVLDKDANDASRFSIFRDGADGLQEEVFRVDEEGNVYARGSFRPASLDLAEYHPVGEAVEAGDVLVADRFAPGVMRKATSAEDKAVVGVVSATPGIELGRSIKQIAAMEPEIAAWIDEARALGDKEAEDAAWAQLEEIFRETHAAVALSGTVACKVDAGYGAVEVGDLLVTSPTAGHAMRADEPAPGTVLGKALEPLNAGAGAIKVLVMLR
ncbi:MAG: hypothetical protein JSV08_03545 [Acidobacteriota bacterium]|nr:MAG: hypothetical protein JSV08_03545 [Acidobacteriota bacterium]